MKSIVLLVLFGSFFVQSSEKASVSPGNSQPPETINSQVADTKKDQSNDEDNWTPDAIKDCLSKVKPSEAIEIEDLFNPYYIRLNFDGNQLVDYAILVRRVNDKKKRGVVICKDSKETFLYGTVSRSKDILDSGNDNFVTDDWEALTKEETAAIHKYDTDGKKVGTDAKGESIGFIFEGGCFFIYWDGGKFKGVGGA